MENKSVPFLGPIHPMKKLLLSLVVFAAIFSANAQPVYACSCMVPGTPAEEMEKSDVVFRGTVTNITDSHDFQGWGYAVTLEVHDAWKGVERNLVKVHTGGDGGVGCGFGFEEGEEYMVYASLTDGELRVHSCSLTGIAKESGFFLRLFHRLCAKTNNKKVTEFNFGTEVSLQYERFCPGNV